jgi:hypothetical protein
MMKLDSLVVGVAAALVFGNQCGLESAATFPRHYVPFPGLYSDS